MKKILFILGFCGLAVAGFGQSIGGGMNVSSATPTASQGLVRVGNDFRLGYPYMLNQPNEFSAARKMNWGNFSNFIGSDTDSTFFNIDLSNKKIGIKSLLTTNADIFSINSGLYKIFDLNHNGDLELRTGADYDSRWFYFNHRTAVNTFRLSIGPGANMSGDGSIGIGYNAIGTGIESIKIGNQGSTNGNYSMAIGLGSSASALFASSVGAHIVNSSSNSYVSGLGRNAVNKLNGRSSYAGMGVYTQNPVMNTGGYSLQTLSGTWARSNDTITITGTAPGMTLGRAICLITGGSSPNYAYVSEVISATQFKIDRTITGTSGSAIYISESTGLFFISEGFSSSSKRFFQIKNIDQRIMFPQYGTGSYTGTPAKNLSVTSTGEIIEVDGDNYIYNVRDYGAIGDSTTNDYTAIQAAINACELTRGIVLFPQGQYRIEQGLAIDTGGVTLVGVGMGASQIIVDNGAYPTVSFGIIVNNSGPDTISNIKIKDLTLRGTDDSDNAPGGMITLQEYVNDFVVENVEMYWSRNYGVRFPGGNVGRNATIRGCNFHDIQTGNMTAADGSTISGMFPNLKVMDCYFEDVGNNGNYHSIYPNSEFSGLHISDCIFVGTHANLSIRDSGGEIGGRNIVANNHFRSTKANNFWNSPSILVTGNTFDNTSIRADNNPVIKGNVFRDTIGIAYFINDEGSGDATIVENNSFEATDSVTIAIKMDGNSNHWEINNNTFRGMANPIYLAGDNNNVKNNSIYSAWGIAPIKLISGADNNFIANNLIESVFSEVINDAGSGNNVFCNEITGGGASVVNMPCGDLLNGGNTGAVVVGSNNSTLELEANGVTGMTMDISQKVGIGTPSPTTEFEVKKDQNAQTDIFVNNPNAGASAYANFRAANNLGAVMDMGIGSDAVSSFGYSNRGYIKSALTSVISTGADIRFFTNGATSSDERVLITAAKTTFTHTGQIPLEIRGGFHSNPTIVAPNVGGNAYIIFENEGDDRESYLFGRKNDGTFNFSQSQSQPYSAEDNIILFGDTTFIDLETQTIEITHLRGENFDTLSIAANANAGTGATVSLTTAGGSDLAGKFSLTTGTTLTAGTWATITFDNAYDAAPTVILQARNEAASDIVNDSWVTETTTGFSVVTSTGITGAGYESTQYDWGYIVVLAK